jgi:hypothetical protein
MEFAIPLIALGGMYVISNQNNQNCDDKNNKTNKKRITEENFTNMGIRSNLATRTDNYLPNTNIPPQNFPVPNLNQMADTVQNYPNPNVATDKYFDQNLYEQKVRKGNDVGQNPQKMYSLTGDYLDTEQFKHNNMKPFFGGKIKGYTYDTQIAETVLDNMIGSGSQVIKKIEQAPLFKPEANMQWAYGMPNNSDFYQSRVNPGMKNNNIKPFDSVYVGPGLDQGYGVNGSNGYNSGMEARDKWLPYTVDQMRVATNPKLEYELINHEGPAEAVIKNVGILGRVEKQHPDTFFINTQDRWLTTTGAEKGETLRPIQELGVIRRNDVVVDYAGPAGLVGRQATTAPENFEPSKRVQLPECDVPISTAVGRGPITDGEVRIQSFTNYSNQRSTIKQPDTNRSGFSGAIGAVIAPLLDVLKPTRKEEIVNNVRIYGDISKSVPSGYVNNPNDTTPTTIKETTLYAPTFNINNQSEGIYVNNYTPMDLTQRDSTSSSYMGSSGGHGTQYGDMLYDSAYRQHNNDIKSSTVDNRANQGGTQIFNQQMHVNINKSDSDRFDGRVNPAYSRLSGASPSVQTYGAIHAPQYYNECANCDRINPDILQAFKNNPYTHSLTTSV